MFQFHSFFLHVGEENRQETSLEPIFLPMTIPVAKDIEYLIDAVLPEFQNNYRDEFCLLQRAILSKRSRVLKMLKNCVGALVSGKKRMCKTAGNYYSEE